MFKLVLEEVQFFNDMTDPNALYSSIRAMDDQADTVGATNPIKCIMMLGNFKGEALNCYVGFLRAYVSGYPNLVWKMSQSFPILKHWEVPIRTSPDNHSGFAGHAREYRDWFNERDIHNIGDPQRNTHASGSEGPSIKKPKFVVKEPINLFSYSVPGEKASKRNITPTCQGVSPTNQTETHLGRKRNSSCNDMIRGNEVGCIMEGENDHSHPLIQKVRTSYKRWIIQAI